MATYAQTATRAVDLTQPDGATRSFQQGEVVNLILWDGTAEISVDEGTELRPVPDGWGVVDGQVVDLSTFPVPPPPPAPPEPTKAELLAQAEALLARINAMPS
ncbi:hypothetical protein VQH23_07355 [Pararoseomonas sp. SCSIO 73927]|uniref:hypothetical protein n=1 Tax=Pararoseomonas sp. SCSIO 73927 TaxID=3114537 RepID=UPI0030CEF3AB